MPSDPTSQATDQLARAQLMLLHALADEMGLTQDGRRLVLELDERTWLAWTGFLSGDSLPAEPPLPEMLRRLSENVFNLAVMAGPRCGRAAPASGWMLTEGQAAPATRTAAWAAERHSRAHLHRR